MCSVPEGRFENSPWVESAGRTEPWVRVPAQISAPEGAVRTPTHHHVYLHAIALARLPYPPALCAIVHSARSAHANFQDEVVRTLLPS
jgi:hypothetical protein